MTSAIEHFVEFNLRARDLECMDEVERAVFGLFCYAVNEINVLSKLYVFGVHDEIDEKAVDSATSIQSQAIIRMWSSKIYEFFVFLGKLSNSQLPSDDFQSFVSSLSTEVDTLKARRGYSINRMIRNETAHHYSFDTAKRNVRFCQSHANASIYLHRLDGNTHFAFGEELMFIERLRRYGESDRDLKEPEKLIEEWLGWARDVEKFMRARHIQLIKDVVLKRLGDVRSRKRSYFVPMEMVAHIGSHHLPVFARSRNGE